MIRLRYIPAERYDECDDVEEGEQRPYLVEVLCTDCETVNGARMTLVGYSGDGLWNNPDYGRVSADQPDEAFLLEDDQVWALVEAHLDEHHDGVPAHLRGPIALAVGYGNWFEALKYLDEHRP